MWCQKADFLFFILVFNISTSIVSIILLNKVFINSSNFKSKIMTYHGLIPLYGRNCALNSTFNIRAKKLKYQQNIKNVRFYIKILKYIHKNNLPYCTSIF